MTFMLINQDLEALAVNSRSPGRMPTLEVAVGAGVGRQIFMLVPLTFNSVDYAVLTDMCQ